jgi:segregation and condensation protein A
MRGRQVPVLHVVAKRAVVTLEEAMERLSLLLGTATEWTRLERFLGSSRDPERRRSDFASSFVAALELARKGQVELRQEAPFAPVELRRAP